jgi:hypothetical protein
MGSLRDMQKEAGLPSLLLTLGFGGMMGAGLGKSVADITDKSQVGLPSRVKWEHEMREHARGSADPDLLRKVVKAKQKAGLIGAATGLGVGVPLAILKKKPIIPLATALIGRSLGRWLTKRKSPISDPDMPYVASMLSNYRGLMTRDQAKSWSNILNDPDIPMENKYNLAVQYKTLAEQTPEYKAWKKKQNLGKIIGGVVGGGLMLAGLRHGMKKKMPAIKDLGFISRGAHNLRKAIFGTGAADKYRKAMQTVSGNTYWPWAGLAAGTAGATVGSQIIGGERANIPKSEIASRALDQALGDVGQNALFYGMMMSPKLKG